MAEVALAHLPIDDGEDFFSLLIHIADISDFVSDSVVNFYFYAESLKGRVGLVLLDVVSDAVGFGVERLVGSRNTLRSVDSISILFCGLDDRSWGSGESIGNRAG